MENHTYIKHNKYCFSFHATAFCCSKRALTREEICSAIQSLIKTTHQLKGWRHVRWYGKFDGQHEKGTRNCKAGRSSEQRVARYGDYGADPSGSVFATFNGLGVPVGLKIADSIMDQSRSGFSCFYTGHGRCSQEVSRGHDDQNVGSVQRSRRSDASKVGWC